jgi:CRP/FNR family transcriptional regulator
MQLISKVEAKTLIETFRKLKATQHLSDSAIQVIADVSIRKKVPFGKKLWSMGDPAEFVGLLFSGVVEINRINSNGKETCMGIFGPSNAVGISAVLKKDQYPASAKSVSKDTEVLKIYLRPVLQDKKHSAYEEISTWLRELLLSHEHILRDKIDILSSGRVEQRVIELLRQLTIRFGLKKGRSSYTIPFAISKTQISRLVEVRVETIIRLLSSWTKDGLILFEKRGIQIPDLERLEQLSEQER